MRRLPVRAGGAEAAQLELPSGAAAAAVTHVHRAPRGGRARKVDVCVLFFIKPSLSENTLS